MIALQWLTRAWLLVALCLGAGSLRAHELSIADLQLQQIAPAEFVWQWAASDKRPASQDLTPRWPAGCTAGDTLLRCGPDGLKGRLTIDGVGQRYSAVLVRVQWLDGQERTYTLTGAQPAVQLLGSADDRRGWAEVVSTYTQLGVAHILGGIDHLLFVVSLLFLVGISRRLVWTISAFTLAHSLTLALSSLGWLNLRPPPVEACIALSILLVASEALHRRDTLARRWPALVAFLFGLVHGLGFAGALREIGLPEHQLVGALLGFNLGVEAGQLLTVAVAGLGWLAWQRLPALASAAGHARLAALYAIGTLAAWWSIDRIVALGS